MIVGLKKVSFSRPFPNIFATPDSLTSTCTLCLKVPFFNAPDIQERDRFVSELATCLSAAVYAPNEVFGRRGAFPVHLFILQRGIIAETSESGWTNFLTSTAYFGTDFLCPQTRMMTSSQAVTFSHVFRLALSEIYNVLRHGDFPETLKLLRVARMKRTFLINFGRFSRAVQAWQRQQEGKRCYVPRFLCDIKWDEYLNSKQCLSEAVQIALLKIDESIRHKEGIFITRRQTSFLKRSLTPEKTGEHLQTNPLWAKSEGGNTSTESDKLAQGNMDAIIASSGQKARQKEKALKPTNILAKANAQVHESSGGCPDCIEVKADIRKLRNELKTRFDDLFTVLSKLKPKGSVQM